MKYFVIDTIDEQGNEGYDLAKFASLEEAQTYVPSGDRVVTKVSLYNPESPAYEFEATNSDGHLVADIIEAPSQEEAQACIEEMGYVITKFSVYDGHH